jgi:hypothetical protein
MYCHCNGCLESSLVQFMCSVFVALWRGSVKYHGPWPSRWVKQVSSWFIRVLSLCMSAVIQYVICSKQQGTGNGPLLTSPNPIECLTNSGLSSVQVFIANILIIAFVILEKMAAFAMIICTSTLVGLVSSCLHSITWATLFRDHLTHHKYFCLNQEKVGSLL